VTEWLFLVLLDCFVGIVKFSFGVIYVHNILRSVYVEPCSMFERLHEV